VIRLDGRPLCFLNTNRQRIRLVQARHHNQNFNGIG
jgi:hypothetical protein